MLVVVAAPWPTSCIFFTEIDVYGTWPFVIYLQTRAARVRYPCVRGSSQGGEFDPSLARFYARAENNLHNDRCARLARTIADEFMLFPYDPRVREY